MSNKQITAWTITAQYCIYLSIYLCILIIIYLSIYLSESVSIYLFIYLSDDCNFLIDGNCFYLQYYYSNIPINS